MKHYLIFCYNTSLSYLQSYCKSNKYLVDIIKSPEVLAIDITASLFKKDEFGKIQFIYQQNITEDECDLKFMIYVKVKEKVDKAIKFEMLKYDLITIEEYNTALK